MKITIVCDLDMVLTKNSDQDFENFLTGNLINIEDYLKFPIDERYKYANEYHAAGNSLTLNPMDDALETLVHLKRIQGCTVEVLIKTDRNKAFSQLVTEKWIHKYYPNIFSHIECTEYVNSERVENKAEFCLRSNAHIFIDDHLEHVQATSKALPGSLVLLYTQKRNLNYKITEDNIVRVSNWGDILKISEKYLREILKVSAS